MSNILKQTVVQEKYLVSTIELGRYFGGSSMEYETMVFHCNAEGEVTDWIELYCDRYSILQAALEGHEAVVFKYQNIGDKYMTEAAAEVEKILGN